MKGCESDVVRSDYHLELPVLGVRMTSKPVILADTHSKEHRVSIGSGLSAERPTLWMELSGSSDLAAMLLVDPGFSESLHSPYYV